MDVCPPVRRAFSDPPGHALRPLPARKPAQKWPVFRIAHDDDDDDDDDDDSLDEHPLPHAVPFPRSSSPPPRGTSVPILLSNGKPLKPSLKSSSSPAMLSAPQMHLRSRSEPSSPATTPKNVHFPEKDYALATVRFFNCKARPAALSSPADANGDETETDGEDSLPASFPFPRIPPVAHYEIDPTKTSVVSPDMPPDAHIHLESINLSSSSSFIGQPPKPLLTGSILVRNIAFEKHVAIRFTLDDWLTVGEVGAHYAESLPSYCPPIPSTSTSTGPTSSSEKGWDRFTFTVRLEDYAPSLSTRTLWLATRYRVSSTYPPPDSTVYGPGGEWWDNNGSKNYRVGFRPAVASPTPLKNRPRDETIFAPITSRRSQPPPPTTCRKHVLGLVIPSLTTHRETEPESEAKKPLASPRIGRLSLCNYVPPKTYTPSSISSPYPGSPQSVLPSSSTHPELASAATSRPSTDEDATSPASSTLSTPSASPTIPPRVIMGRQRATYSSCPIEKEEDALGSKSVRIADWEWSALSKSQVDVLPRSNALSPTSKSLVNDPLYDAFVSRWCFAQGPSSNHGTFGDGGIMT